jgi:peptidoglycan-associated lipoprotein
MDEMVRKIVSLSALALLLAACECGSDSMCQKIDATTAVTPGTSADFRQNIRDRVFFAYDSTKVQPSGEDVLKQQAAWFKVHQNTSAVVEGHCDVRGSTEYNMALGHKRAQAAQAELKKFGVEDSRLKVISYGKERPQVANATDEIGHAQNRVAVTVVN